MSNSSMTREEYIHRIEFCRDKLRQISDGQKLGDGTHETWACGITASHLLPDLMDMQREAAFQCVDEDHRVYRCGNCGELWKFEADGPFENGWNCCPKCGLLIKQPEEEDK